LGKGGTVKKKIESYTRTKIRVSREGDVEIEGQPVGTLTAKDIVRAIGRGFIPRKAFLLLEEENHLNVISLEGHTEKTIKRLLSRVIGRGGRARRNIERLSGASLRIYGKTVSIIGSQRAVSLASSAVEDLLEGRTHVYAYSKLEKRKRM
jgi:ribosomal RNA assembly protein